MSKWIKEHVKISIFLLVAILFLIPLLMSWLLKFKIFNFAPGEVGVWIGFWGSYLGAIVGLSAVVFSTTIQLKAQKEYIKQEVEMNDKQERERLYINLLIDRSMNLESTIMELNSITSKRYNVIRNYSALRKSIQTVGLRIDFDKKIGIPKKESTEKKIKEVNKEIDSLRNEDTRYRGEMIHLSARLKAELIFFPNLEVEIEKLRDMLHNQMNYSYDMISDKDANMDDLKSWVERDSDVLQKQYNIILGIVNEELKNISKLLNP